MRELKFRAWVEVDKKMYYATLYEIIRNVGFDYGVPSNVVGFIDNGVHEKAHITQFTGLHDSTGREIYEGDVWRSNENGLECIGFVEYHGCLFRVNYGDTSDILGHAVRYGKVIGNIYENPELLNG